MIIYSYAIFLPKKLQTQASKGKDDEPPPPPFAGLKLKPRKPVQRKPKVEEPQTQPFKVELKHHEFEKPPQNEEVEMDCSIILSNAFVDKELEETEEQPGSKIVINRKKPKVVKETLATEETSTLKPASSVAELQKNQAVTLKNLHAHSFCCVLGRARIYKSDILYNHR